MKLKKQQLELDMEQQTGSKLGKEYNKAIYGHPVYIIYMLICRIHHAKCQAGCITNWNQDFLEKYQYNNLRYADDTTLMAESEERLSIS